MGCLLNMALTTMFHLCWSRKCPENNIIGVFGLNIMPPFQKLQFSLISSGVDMDIFRNCTCNGLWTKPCYIVCHIVCDVYSSNMHSFRQLPLFFFSFKFSLLCDFKVDTGRCPVYLFSLEYIPSITNIIIASSTGDAPGKIIISYQILNPVC